MAHKEEIAELDAKIRDIGHDPNDIDMTASGLTGLVDALHCRKESAAASKNTVKARANTNVVAEGSTHALRFQDGCMTATRALKINSDAARKTSSGKYAGYGIGTVNASRSAAARVKDGLGFGKWHREKAYSIVKNVRELVAEHPAAFSIHKDGYGFTIAQNGMESPDLHVNLFLKKVRPTEYEDGQLGSQAERKKKMIALKRRVMDSISRPTSASGELACERFFDEGGKRVKLASNNPGKRRHAASYVFRKKDTTGAPLFA